MRDRDRPAGSSATNMAIRKGKQHTLAALAGARIQRPHPFLQSQSSQVSQRRCQRRGQSRCQRTKRPLIQLTMLCRPLLFTLWDAVSSTFVHTLGGLRTVSGCCPLCNEHGGARMDKPSACKRRVLENSGLGLTAGSVPISLPRLVWQETEAGLHFTAAPTCHVRTAIGCATPAT